MTIIPFEYPVIPTSCRASTHSTISASIIEIFAFIALSDWPGLSVLYWLIQLILAYPAYPAYPAYTDLYWLIGLNSYCECVNLAREIGLFKSNKWEYK